MLKFISLLERYLEDCPVAEGDITSDQAILNKKIRAFITSPSDFTGIPNCNRDTYYDCDPDSGYYSELNEFYIDGEDGKRHAYSPVKVANVLGTNQIDKLSRSPISTIRDFFTKQHTENQADLQSILDSLNDQSILEAILAQYNEIEKDRQSSHWIRKAIQGVLLILSYVLFLFTAPAARIFTGEWNPGRFFMSPSERFLDDLKIYGKEFLPKLLTCSYNYWDQRKYSIELVKAFHHLFEIDPDLVNDKNVQFLTKHRPVADELSKIVSLLYRINPNLVNNESLLNDWDEQFSNASIVNIRRILEKLKDTEVMVGNNNYKYGDRIITQETFLKIVKASSSRSFSRFMMNSLYSLEVKHTLGNATQESDIVKAYQTALDNCLRYDPILDAVPYYIWDQIPAHLLSNPTFKNGILGYCRDADARTNFGRTVPQRFTNDMISNTASRISNYIWDRLHQRDERPNQQQAAALLNTQQSTHTTSVHKSVSESADRLMQTYGKEIEKNKLEKTIAEIKKWGANLKPEDINIDFLNRIRPKEGEPISARFVIQTVQRTLTRLTNITYSFEDPTSKVSTLQLLALSWKAIHDNEKREGELKDAKQLFLEGLYEAAREYNLDEAGREVGNIENPTACAAGTFNKLMEKLVGISPCVELRFVTKKTATLKLQTLVIDALNTYFQEKIKEANTPDALNTIKKEISEGGVPDALWDTKKQEITKILVQEYGEAYSPRGEKETEADYQSRIEKNREFATLLEAAPYVSLPVEKQAALTLQILVIDALNTYFQEKIKAANTPDALNIIEKEIGKGGVPEELWNEKKQEITHILIREYGKALVPQAFTLPQKEGEKQEDYQARITATIKENTEFMKLLKAGPLTSLPDEKKRVLKTEIETKRTTAIGVTAANEAVPPSPASNPPDPHPDQQTLRGLRFTFFEEKKKGSSGSVPESTQPSSRRPGG